MKQNSQSLIQNEYANSAMRSLLSILTLLIFCSCVPQQNAGKTDSDEELLDAFLSVMQDSTSSFEEAMVATLNLSERLHVLCSDEEDINSRMKGQKWGYMVISFLTDKYDQFKERGVDVDEEVFSLGLNVLGGAINQWFYNNDTNNLPFIWRDHYYVSHKTSDTQVEDYIRIAAILPMDEDHTPALEIFFPDCAVPESGVIYFSNNTYGSLREDMDYDLIITPDTWFDTDTIGASRCGIWPAEALEAMMSHELMYISFVSEATPDDEPEVEMSRVILQGFQDLFAINIASGE